MKQFVLFFLIIISSFSLEAQNIAVKGSDTMLPLVQELADLYMNNHSGSSVAVSGGGSLYGIEGLQNGSAQIAMCSRSLTNEESLSMPSVDKVAIAYDAVTIIVHSSNKVNQLTRKQLQLILTGLIHNWKEVGGEDLPIQVISRNEKSGTVGFLKSRVLNGKSITDDALTLHSNASVVDQVSTNKGAIGYIGLAHVVEIVKTVAVSFDGHTYVKPTFKNALEKKYPMMRPLYYYFNRNDSLSLKGFQEFTLSSQGQKIASYNGYIPAKLEYK